MLSFQLHTMLIHSKLTSHSVHRLAFSPDKRHMYFALQQKGLLFDITRNDGNPFGAQILDVKHK